LRLEIAFDIDKKKSELYFSFSVKKILTEKPKRACPQAVEIFSLSATGHRLCAHRHFLCFTTLVMCSCASDSTCRAF